MIYEKSSDIIDAKLKKEIIRDNGIRFKNFIKFNQNDNYKKIEWEDIGNIYYFDEVGYLVCPKGNSFMHSYQNGKFQMIQPYNYIDNHTYELICFYQNKENTFIQGLLKSNSEQNLIYLRNSFSNNWNSIEIYQGLFDFIWSENQYQTQYDGYFYIMFALFSNDSSLCFGAFPIKIENYNFYIQYEKIDILFYQSQYTNAYFNNEQ